MAGAAIRTPGGIWAKLIEAAQPNAKKQEGRGDAFAYFVGARGSGKSTLLNRFLYPARVSGGERGWARMGGQHAKDAKGQPSRRGRHAWGCARMRAWG
jgi:hypothetical protein